MTNAEIADAFEKIGKILDLQGENPFRVRAYERAALTIATLSQDLAEIHGKGGIKALREIPGIGEDLSNKIEEMLKTGKLKFLSELQKKVPQGVLDMMEIPGVGPKKAKMLWQKFRVQSAPDLEKLTKTGKLTKLKGWGEKSVENIVKGIRVRKESGTRIALPAALPIAESLVEGLRRTRLCRKVEIAGSLRRRKETIGDIDILATSDEPNKVMDAYCAFPQVRSIIGRGPTKASVRLISGLQADLRVLPDEDFGAALYYFTGSKEHNVHLRTIGIKKGITISEYGVFKGTAEKKGKKIASRTEEDIFRSVGLPYIPPELREDRGEIEAAQRSALPTLIEVRDIHGDLHIHSDFSDGNATMMEMVKAAEAVGHEYMAMTDHGSPMGMVRGLKKENIKEYLKRIEEARHAVPGIRILSGVEVDILEDGRLYLPDDVLAQLDWVVASVHGKFQMPREEMTKRIIRAIENPYVHVIGHPTTRLLPRRPGIEFDTEAVFQAAKKHNVALELNASIYRLDLNDVLCKRAKDMGVKVCIDTDAHSPTELDLSFGIAQARRGWLEKRDVINTLRWNDVDVYLKQKR